MLTSLSFPAGTASSNQRRNLTNATPSRSIALRKPACSVSFFTAFIRATGDEATMVSAYCDDRLYNASLAKGDICKTPKCFSLNERRSSAKAGYVLISTWCSFR